MEEEEQQNLFIYNNLSELNTEDFALQSTDGLVLYAGGCSIVLFYGQDPISKALQGAWLDLAGQYADINFFGVNMAERRDIAKRMGQIRNSPNHPFNWAVMARTPYIMAFREADDPGLSYPQAFYNGDLDIAQISSWIVTLACQPGYTDRISVTMQEFPAPIPVEDIEEDVEMKNPPMLTRQYADVRSTPPRPGSTPSAPSMSRMNSPWMSDASQTPIKSRQSKSQQRLEELDSSVEAKQTQEKSVPGSGVGFVRF